MTQTSDTFDGEGAHPPPAAIAINEDLGIPSSPAPPEEAGDLTSIMRHNGKLLDALPSEPVNPRHLSGSNEHFTPKEFVDAARALMGGIDLDPASCPLADRVVGATRIFTAKDNGFQREWRGKTFLNPPGGKMDKDGCSLVSIVIGTDASGKPKKELRRADNGEKGSAMLSSQKEWWFKLVSEYVAGRVEQAIFVSFSVELLQTSQVKSPPGLPLPHDFPLCFPKTRVAYDHPNEAENEIEGSDSPPHASMFVWLPPRAHAQSPFELYVPHEDVLRRYQKYFGGFGRCMAPR